jgi:hypothetical protein
MALQPTMRAGPVLALHGIASCVRAALNRANEKSLDQSRKPRERTEWHRTVTWGRTAAACAQHLGPSRRVHEAEDPALLPK